MEGDLLIAVFSVVVSRCGGFEVDDLEIWIVRGARLRLCQPRLGALLIRARRPLFLVNSTSIQGDRAFMYDSTIRLGLDLRRYDIQFHSFYSHLRIQHSGHLDLTMDLFVEEMKTQ